MLTFFFFFYYPMFFIYHISSEVKRKWGSLRDYKRKLIKSRKPGPSGSAASAFKMWHLDQEMEFLTDTFTPDESTSSLDPVLRTASMPAVSRTYLKRI